MDYAIEVKGLTKKYNGFTLDHVSFQIPTGSIVGFIGENGAGKSTTIKAILDLIQRDSGEVQLFGKKDGAQDKELKEDISVIFDECYFPDGLRVLDVNQMMKQIYRHWEPATFLEYCRRFDLPDKRPVKEFSRGMKVKLSIAVGLSHKAKLIILDDACGSLDPIVRNEILDIFMEFIQEEDHTVFLSSHITSDIEKICDYILLIHKGRLLFFENKDALLYDYGVVRCSEEQYREINPELIVGVQKNRFEVEVLVNNRHILDERPHDYVIDQASIEDILLYVVKCNL
ncbi:MAG: ABC transporter ATP-binding protein [Lachnospiraceae bacterium]|jgi:ABC-2 type transport system ATP-binding protein|nr:ABC transporter ATP-binding protein [Lachnospiraceae bacterium]